MAMVSNMAMLVPMAVGVGVDESGSRRAAGSEREREAEQQLVAAFEQAGWTFRRQDSGDRGADLFVRRRGVTYAIELKAAAEGRGDRLIPLFAQAVLQSKLVTPKNAAALVVVAAPRIGRRAAAQVIEFARQYAPNVAAGVVDFAGLRLFHGPHLEGLNAEPAIRTLRSSPQRDSGHLFSDLNQWMLKVLLAPELPPDLLAAPRDHYRNASELGRAANVSIMSAFRFVQQLGHEGYLDESAPHLSLVRREDLFSRWQASAVRSVKEMPLKLKLPGDPRKQLQKLLTGGQSCLALFAAADALGLGFVEGVPPFVYVPRIAPAGLRTWRSVRPCAVAEQPDLVLRQAPAPESVFRAMVSPHGLHSCDVLQVWADVATHPARGREQAELIRRRVLQRVIGARR
jgi:hypothetical protein